MLKADIDNLTVGEARNRTLCAASFKKETFGGADVHIKESIRTGANEDQPEIYKY